MLSWKYLKKRVLAFFCLFSIVSYLGFSTFRNTEEQHTVEEAILDEFASFDDLTRDSVVNCSNVEEIRILKQLGMGFHRRTYLAMFRGEKVVVKMAKVTFDSKIRASMGLIEDSSTSGSKCLQKFHENRHQHIKDLLSVVKYECNSEHIKHMLVEILYHTVVKAVDGIVKQLGFCVHSPAFYMEKESHAKGLIKSVKEMDTDTVTEDGSIVSVYEYGNVVDYKEARSLANAERITHIRQVASTIIQLRNTLVGPIAIVDTGFKHVVSIDGKWKMFDLGFFENGEISCDRELDDYRYSKVMVKLLHAGRMEGNTCPYDVSCFHGVCQGLMEVLIGV